MPGNQVAYQMKFKPIILKQLILDCGFMQNQVATEGLRSGKSVLNLIVNRGYAPTTIPDYQARIEAYLLRHSHVIQWLQQKGITIKDIWLPLGGDDLRLKGHINKGKKMVATRGIKAMVPGDIDKIQIREVEMIHFETMKHFKLFRNPFQDDIDISDIYMSEEHRYIKEAMLDAAKHSGFIAVIGEVGSGKTCIRRLIVHELRKDDNLRIIFPRIVDKTRITASSICDAIILDLEPDAKPKSRLEQKSRQVENMLLARSKAGCRFVIIIEEAHDLKECPRVLKLLKRFYEIEDGYKKVLGIILVGQPELGELFNETDHYDMREVIRRCQVAYIRGLNGNVKDYLTLKFKRVGADLKNIITDEAIEALAKRLLDKDLRGKPLSKAYPLTVNNYIIRAMNMAFEMGESMITADVMLAI